MLWSPIASCCSAITSPGDGMSRFADPIAEKDWAASWAACGAARRARRARQSRLVGGRSGAAPRLRPDRRGLALEDAGIPVYDNASVRLEKDGAPFWIAGLGDQWAF